MNRKFEPNTIFLSSIIAAASILVILSVSITPNSTSAQLETPSSEDKPLPVILIHGYASDSSVWNEWDDLLERDRIPYSKVSFGYPRSYYDQCWFASSHGDDLTQKIQKLKAATNSEQVNIVGHSKGGLDAREYLDNVGADDVANLIMIGTPNAGSSLAYSNNYCAPAVFDIRPGSEATEAPENTDTKYYTIAGDWNPSLMHNCPPVDNFFGLDWPQLQVAGFSELGEPSDGIVTINSVESLNYSTSLGHTTNCHTNLMGESEYNLTKSILKPEH